MRQPWVVDCDRSDYQHRERFRGTVLGLLGGGEQVLLTPFYSFLTVSFGKLPGSDALESVPLFPTSKEADSNEPRDPAAARVVQQTNTLMSLINAHESLNVASKTSRVWLWEGLGSILKRVHERMLQWEFMDMVEFSPLLFSGAYPGGNRH